MPRNNTTTLPKTVRNELRSVIAIRSYDLVYKKKGMKIKEQRDLMQKMYLGSEEDDIACHIDLLLSGKGAYKDLFEESMVSDRNDDSGTRLTLLWKYHRTDRTFHTSAGSNKEFINKKTLRKTTFTNKAKDVNGKMLHSNAKAIMPPIKKAIAIVKPLLNEDGSPKESGKTEEDVDTHVLNKMFETLEGKSSIEDPPPEEEEECDDDDDNDKQPSNLKEMPDDYIFSGWMAFKLFGPMQPPEKCLALFTTDKEPTNEKTNRKTSRQEEATDKATAHSNATDERGLTLRDRALLAQIELKKKH